MKRQFLDFRKLITDGLLLIDQNRANTEQTVLLKEQLLLLPKIKDDILTGVTLTMFAGGKAYCITRQLHQLQKDSALLLNMLWNHAPKEERGVFYEHASACLIEISESLQHYNNEYFDLDQKIPLYLFESFSVELKEKILLLKAALKGKNVGNTLQQVIIGPYEGCLKKGTITYWKMHYLLKLFDNLMGFLKGNGGFEFYGALHTFLLRCGLNTTDFNHYYTLKIAAETEERYNVEEQFNLLYSYERVFSVLPKKLNMCYEHKRPNSHNVLLNFVLAEINYLTKKEEHCTPNLAYARVTPAPSLYRIKTNLTVDGLVYMFRLLIEAEAIDANPRSDLLAFIGQHFQTPKIKDGPISAYSLKIKYKQVTQSTTIGVRALLVKMIKQIDANFSRQ
jgi:hypothetical protein